MAKNSFSFRAIRAKADPPDRQASGQLPDDLFVSGEGMSFIRLLHARTTGAISNKAARRDALLCAESQSRMTRSHPSSNHSQRVASAKTLSAFVVQRFNSPAGSVSGAACFPTPPLRFRPPLSWRP